MLLNNAMELLVGKNNYPNAYQIGIAQRRTWL
jgi:hypothetical protein